jgi:hypothetical protein
MKYLLSLMLTLSTLFSFSQHHILNGASVSSTGEILFGTADVPIVSSDKNAPFVVYLDFDGYFVDSASSWFVTAGKKEKFFAGSRMDSRQMRYAYNMVAEDFKPFNVNVTTDKAEFDKAAFDKRVHVVVTPDNFMSGWGGVAWIGLLWTGNHNVCWVFESALGSWGKYVGDAASHEAGHVIGLNHQGVYDTTNCSRLYTYNWGEQDEYLSWAPIMGTSYNASLGTWDMGQYTDYCPHTKQDDIAKINKIISTREDDFTSTKNLETYYDTSYYLREAQFGVIETSTDVDVFAFTVNKETRLWIDLTADSENGSDISLQTGNIDIKVTLRTPDGTTIVYAPPTLEDVHIDTVVAAGTYTIAVEGDGNKFMRKYSSLGGYRVGFFGVHTQTNVAPIVNAGADAHYDFTPDKQHREFTFQLVGTASDADNNIDITSWEQINGNGVIELTGYPDNTAEATVRQGGKYTFHFYAIDKAGAKSFDTVEVTITRAPFLDVELGQSIELCEGTILSAGFPNEFPFQFKWSTGDTTNSIVINQGGEYWVKVDSAGVSNADTVYVEVKRTPVVRFFGDTEICRNSNTTIGATEAVDDYNYRWNNGSTAPTRTVTAAGKYTLVVTSRESECSIKHDFNVTYKNPLQRLSFNGVNEVIRTDNSVCVDNPIDLASAPSNAPALYSNIIYNNVTLTVHEEDYFYQVVGVTGQVFAKGKLVSGKNTFSVLHLQPGVYIIKVVKGNKVTVHKIFKK